MASQTLAIGSAQKSAGSRIRIPADFGDVEQLIDGYSIVSYQVTYTGSDSVLQVTGTQLDYPYQLSCLCYSGTSGATYYLTYTITLNDPDNTIISCTGTLQVL